MVALRQEAKQIAEYSTTVSENKPSQLSYRKARDWSSPRGQLDPI